MNSMTVYLIFVPILALVLLLLNVLLGPSNPYSEKSSSFECGFHSFLGQNRQQFSISFFIFALLFLLFDLEILLVYPYVVSAYNNEIYGLWIVLIFLGVLTAGFVFEIGRGALKINSRQTVNLQNSKINSLSNLNNAYGSKSYSSLSLRRTKNHLPPVW
jgi:NADH-ubiquinone oxidoreductase chain 3